MKAVVVQVMQTALNLSDMIQGCQAMNLPNPADKADSKGYLGLKHTLTTLDSIQREPYLSATVLHLGYMVVTDWQDMPLVLSYTGGMPHVYHDGAVRFPCVIIAGSVSQWIDSCRRACSPDADKIVRYVFNKVYLDLQKHMPLKDRREDAGDGTFLLEDLR